jgi:hypothetical protein
MQLYKYRACFVCGRVLKVCLQLNTDVTYGIATINLFHNAAKRLDISFDAPSHFEFGSHRYPIMSVSRLTNPSMLSPAVICIHFRFERQDFSYVYSCVYLGCSVMSASVGRLFACGPAGSN